MKCEPEIATERPSKSHVLVATVIVAALIPIGYKATQAMSEARKYHELEHRNLELYREIDTLTERRDVIRLDIKAAQGKLEELKVKRVKR